MENLQETMVSIEVFILKYRGVQYMFPQNNNQMTSKMHVKMTGRRFYDFIQKNPTRQHICKTGEVILIKKTK